MLLGAESVQESASSRMCVERVSTVMPCFYKHASFSPLCHNDSSHSQVQYACVRSIDFLLVAYRRPRRPFNNAQKDCHSLLALLQPLPQFLRSLDSFRNMMLPNILSINRNFKLKTDINSVTTSSNNYIHKEDAL